MIGQQEILKQIDSLIDNGFPRFVVITGQKGQGKKYLANQIAKKLNYPMVVAEIKIDDIRQIIELSYKHTEPIIYLIPDADKMSIGAKNSLLKVIEEPPNNAYFIMTLQTMENTLSTIKSRCIELKMNNYTEEDINEFINELKPDIESLERCIIEDTCINRYQIQLFIKYGITEFYKYVDKVVKNIYKVQSANSFKLAEKLDIKNDGNGYDLELFFQTYKSICMNYLVDTIDNEDEELNYYNCYAKSIELTSDYCNKLKITGINRQSLIDCWILSIRKIWLNY